MSILHFYIERSIRERENFSMLFCNYTRTTPGQHQDNCGKEYTDRRIDTVTGALNVKADFDSEVGGDIQSSQEPPWGLPARGRVGSSGMVQDR